MSLAVILRLLRDRSRPSGREFGCSAGGGSLEGEVGRREREAQRVGGPGDRVVVGGESTSTPPNRRTRSSVATASVAARTSVVSKWVTPLLSAVIALTRPSRSRSRRRTRSGTGRASATASCSRARTRSGVAEPPLSEQADLGTPAAESAPTAASTSSVRPGVEGVLEHGHRRAFGRPAAIASTRSRSAGSPGSRTTSTTSTGPGRARGRACATVPTRAVPLASSGSGTPVGGSSRVRSSSRTRTPAAASSWTVSKMALIGRDRARSAATTPPSASVATAGITSANWPQPREWKSSGAVRGAACARPAPRRRRWCGRRRGTRAPPGSPASRGPSRAAARRSRPSTRSRPTKRSGQSGTMPAKRRATSAWSLASTLTPKTPLAAISAWLYSRRSRQIETSGGSRLTLENELAVMPWAPSGVQGGHDGDAAGPLRQDVTERRRRRPWTPPIAREYTISASARKGSLQYRTGSRAQALRRGPGDHRMYRSRAQSRAPGGTHGPTSRRRERRCAPSPTSRWSTG